ncbi:MAG TPA: hypothetical protein VHZ29_08200 [Rhizomicrobium sp.]|nr:hypothetical protein [Rhizomicrobium sp.]
MGIAGEADAPDMAWHERAELQPDFVESRLRRYLAGRAPAAGGALKLANRIAFIGEGQLCDDLGCFAEVTALRPGGPAVPADLLLIAGDWPRAGDPWREALLNASPAATARLRETIARYRSQGVPAALWVTGEAETAGAFLHLKDAVDAVFVPAGADVPGAQVLEPFVNVKLFNPFSENAQSRADAAYFRFAVDGVHELSRLGAPEAVLELVKPFLKFNSWLIDSSYHYQVANMKLAAACRRRFIGHVGHAERAALLKMVSGLYLPSALAARRPVSFRKRALEAQASKALVFSDGDGPADGILRFQDAAQLEALLDRVRQDEVGAMVRAHRAWRDAVSHHTVFERLETILAAVKVTPVYNQPPRPRVNVVMPTLRPEHIPFALEMFRSQTWRETALTIVANGVQVPEPIVRQIRETPGASLCAVPQDKTIGYCMNFGIDRADADYWAKWDDDDVYGPHILEDQMLQRKYLDFDVAGKAAIFNYIEERDGVFVRDFAVRDTVSRHLGGGTLLVRNLGRYFAEDGRGAEDRAFLHLARERGDRIVSGDPFNFMQVRRKDSSTHTWARGPRLQDLRGPERRGLSLDGIIV